MWEQVARTLKPLGKPVSYAKRPPKSSVPSSNPAPTQNVPSLTGIGTRKLSEPLTRVTLSADPFDATAAAPVRMDRKAYGRMRKGKLVPEDRLDLHGMTADQAHSALIGFISGARARRLRLVLVITGKGRAGREAPHAMTARTGVLRHQVPEWLAQPPLSGFVLQVAPAHRSHGGSGAYYVYLRRR